MFVILVLLLSIPAIQTRLGKRVTNWLNKEYGTNITVGKVGLQFNGDVELKEIFVEDYKSDTLFNINELNTSILSINNFINNKLTFGDIDIEGLTFNLKTYKGERDTNLDVFIDRFDKNTTSSSSDFLLSSSDVTIEDSVFRLIDDNKETPVRLDFNNLNINATNFVINNSDVNARINTLSFKDSRGVAVTQASTNFSYTTSKMNFEDLKIETEKSSVEGQLAFDYKREDLQFFEDKVNVTASFKNAEITLDELNTFYNEFGKNQKARFNANFTGTLNDLNVKNLKLNTSRNSKIYGDINFKNLFNSAEDNFLMDGNFTNLSSNYNDLKALLPNVLGESIPSAFTNLGNFTIVGNSKISAKDINAKFDIETQLGFVRSNLQMEKIDDIDNASYFGNIILDEFDLGVFLNDPNLSVVSANLDVNGAGFTRENVNTRVGGDVYAIKYNNYEYQNVNVLGDLQDKIFKGKAVIDDENAKLNFDGLVDFSKDINTFDFKADIKHLDLKTLNFYKKDSISVLKGFVDINMKGTNLDDAYGKIKFKNANYKNQNEDYSFKDLTLTSAFKDNERIIDVDAPEIIKGGIKGNFKVNQIAKLVENAVGSIYTNYNPHPVDANQHIDFNFTIYNKIVEVFYNDLKIGKNTYIKGEVDSDEKQFKLNFKSPKLTYNKYFADNIAVQVDNNNPIFNTFIEIDSLHTEVYNVSEFNLINATVNDTLFMRSEFKGGKRNSDIYNLNFYHTINNDNKSVVGFKTSDVVFKNNKWFINENKDRYNKVTFDKQLKNFDIEKFVMSHNGEKMQLSGIISKFEKDLKLDFTNVNLLKITPDLDNVKLEGIVNGKLDVKQKNGNYLPNSTITVDAFKLNNFQMGDFKADIIGNNSLTSYNISASLKDDISKSLYAVGSLDVSGKNPSIDLQVDLDKLNLKPLNSFLEGVLSDVRGIVTGRAKVSGNLSKPNIEGGLMVDNAGIGIPYLNVDYAFQNKALVALKNQSFIFNEIELTDTEFNTKGVLNGALSHINFNDWALDIDLSSDNIVVLNTEESDLPYYGTAFISGDAKLSGPAEKLLVEVENGETQPGTVFKIPLNDAETFGDDSSIHFLSPEEKLARQKGNEDEDIDLGGLELKFDLNVTDDAEVEMILDKASGSTIKGKGGGLLFFDINTNGSFNIYGEIAVLEGTYDFFYGGLIQKQFTVDPGGTIVWEGDPYQAQLNLKAIYSTNTNPSPLLDNPINTRIPVNVGILLNGRLDQLDPRFDFDFPNISSTLKSELNYRLSSEDQKTNQAINLLAMGSFSRGLDDINVTGTIAERLNGIVNSLIGDNNGKFNVGVNYEIGQKRPDYQTDDRVGVTLQTKITDRILINGKVGVPVGGATQSVVAGDVQIDFLLNPDGTLVATVFNRENSIQNFADKIGYTQGVGISYNVEFDSFKELIGKIFKGKPKVKTENEVEEQDNPLPDGFRFKTATEKNTPAKE